MPASARRRIRHAARARVTVALALVAAASVGVSRAVSAQPKDAATPQRLTIPFLANATTPAELDYAAAECDVVADGQQLECRFRQMFLIAPPFDPTTCVVTTNGYERTFHRENDVRWVSADPPAGECGIVETTTLEDGGGTHWTMRIRSEATIGADRAECRAATEAPQVYDWRGMKRTLPCTSIQPGAIER